MKNYAKLGLAALAVIIIVLILWFTGVFGGAEHNSRQVGNCQYPLPNTTVIPEDYYIGGAATASGDTRTTKTTRNVYGFIPAWNADFPFDLPRTDYNTLGGHPSLYNDYFNYMQGKAQIFTVTSLNPNAPWNFNTTNFFTAATSTPYLTPSQYANNDQRRAANLTPLSTPLVPVGCGVNAWTTPANCAIQGAVNYGNAGACVAPAGTVPNFNSTGYVCSSASADGKTRQRNTLSPNTGVANTATANCGDVLVTNNPAPAGCVIAPDNTETACANVTPVAHPYRVVTNTSMPASRATPVAASTLESIGLSASGGITGITGTLAGVENVDLLTASTAEITANDLRVAGSPTVYLCCQTIQNARDADTAANTEFTNNKATVLDGRQAEIARLTALVARLGAMATAASGALGAAQTSATTILNTKYTHGFSSTGSIRA